MVLPLAHTLRKRQALHTAESAMTMGQSPRSSPFRHSHVGFVPSHMKLRQRRDTQTLLQYLSLAPTDPMESVPEGALFEPPEGHRSWVIR